MRCAVKTGLILIEFIGLLGCNAGPNQTNIELNQNMMDQVTVKAQDWDPNHPGAVQMRVPPEHTMPRERVPYVYANDPAAGEAEANPLRGDFSAETLTLGKNTYAIYCQVCHGETGVGDGPVAEKMAVKPRNLLTPEGKAYSDGRIYYAISAGRGVMGSYASQIPDVKARWAVVNYVRTLQR